MKTPKKIWFLFLTNDALALRGSACLTSQFYICSFTGTLTVVTISPTMAPNDRPHRLCEPASLVIPVLGFTNSGISALKTQSLEYKITKQLSCSATEAGFTSLSLFLCAVSHVSAILSVLMCLDPVNHGNISTLCWYWLLVCQSRTCQALFLSDWTLSRSNHVHIYWN